MPLTLLPVTIADIRYLTGTDIPDDKIQFFIDNTNVLVSLLFESVAPPIVPALLRQIQIYLTGHLFVLSVEGGGIIHARAGMSEENYKSFGYEVYGFMTTRFGQLAVALDSSGTLSKLSKKEVFDVMFEALTNDKAPQTARTRTL